MKERHTPVCTICRSRHANRGIQVLAHVICEPCEKQIIGLQCDDPVYLFYLCQLKKLWEPILP
ncbi:Inhibitor of sigma-G Gin [Seinonella peptonophila]|uniref:Inhibitor of sigma-G Gin n=1 Tax=Seinonella peptonophila TaxID=112248 RepID=A0A1M4YKD8_9BACL|nr:sigma factor G inhibitor Gin [Seinonella peptonophila]SHF06200.1 Inhibitor of sigma-G Gin [Seinonella peptonophila]